MHNITATCSMQWNTQISQGLDVYRMVCLQVVVLGRSLISSTKALFGYILNWDSLASIFTNNTLSCSFFSELLLMFENKEKRKKKLKEKKEPKQKKNQTQTYLNQSILICQTHCTNISEMTRMVQSYLTPRRWTRMFPVRHQDEQALHRTGEGCWGTSHAKVNNWFWDTALQKGFFFSLEGCK